MKKTKNKSVRLTEMPEIEPLLDQIFDLYEKCSHNVNHRSMVGITDPKRGYVAIVFKGNLEDCGAIKELLLSTEPE
jgi:hypothetical protein